MSDMGMFGHVPTAEEAGAKAFAMERRLQEQWSWPSYCCGLSDAGVNDAHVTHVMIAALNGEFSHNTEAAFSGELEDMYDPYEELDELRELARDAYATLLFYVGKYNEAEASLCAEYGEDDAIAKLDRECDNDVMLLERRMKLMGIEVKQ